MTSTIESRPNPINATEDGAVPAATATTASKTLMVMVAATNHRIRRASTSQRWGPPDRDGRPARRWSSSRTGSMAGGLPAGLLVHRKNHPEQLGQRVPESVIGQFVFDPPSLWDRDDQATPAQAGQMVGQALPGHTKMIGQIGRERRGLSKGKQYTRPGRV